MSGLGAPQLSELNASHLRVAIVASSWHEQVMSGLVAGAQRVCDAAQVHSEVIRVPGTFELPIVCANLASDFDALVALGVVIRGGTPHFDYVCRAATDGLVRVSLDAGKPIGFGVLTCDNESQALARAGLADSQEDKGAEAAQAAIATVLTLAEVSRPAGRVGLGF